MRKTKLALNLVCGTLLAGCAVAPAIVMTSCSEAPITIDTWGNVYSYEQSNEAQEVYLIINGPEYNEAAVKSVEWSFKYIINGVEAENKPTQITVDTTTNKYCQLTLSNFSNELTDNIKVKADVKVTQIDGATFNANTSIEFKKTSIVLTEPDVYSNVLVQTGSSWLPVHGSMDQMPTNGNDLNVKAVVASPIIRNNSSASATYNWELVSITDADGNTENLPSELNSVFSWTTTNNAQLDLTLNKSSYTLETGRLSEKTYIWNFKCTVNFLGSTVEKMLPISARVMLAAN